jgi:hypothetical protein
MISRLGLSLLAVCLTLVPMADGTEAGTVLLKDICPGACSGSPQGMKVSNGVLFSSPMTESTAGSSGGPTAPARGPLRSRTSRPATGPRRGSRSWARQGVTGGCGNGSHCPGQPVTRTEMAVFLVANFGLSLP